MSAENADENQQAKSDPATGTGAGGIKLSQELERLKRLRRYKAVRNVITASAVFLSALLQAFTIRAFVNPAELLSSGFTGLAILIDRVTSLFGFSFPTFIGMIVLNIPVAVICWKSINRRFVLFSMAQVFLSSFFLNQFNAAHVLPPFHNILLEVVFGGFLYGLSIALALKGGASTAGTDFISLMVSNKTGHSIWGLVFAGNCIVLCIFGSMFGWDLAAYSIIFQFISTKTIETFYHRYDRMTLQVTTSKPQEVLDAYRAEYRHGSSCVEATGGYSGKPYWVITTVVSSYEVGDIVALIRTQDERAVVNVLRTEDFFGGFYRDPIN